jgi:ribosomal protein L23
MTENINSSREYFDFCFYQPKMTVNTYSYNEKDQVYTFELQHIATKLEIPKDNQNLFKEFMKVE